MKISDMKVRTRLFAGFFALLLIAVVIAVFSQRELSHLNETVNQLTTEDWETITLANGLRTDVRSVSEHVSEFLLADAADRPAVRAKLDEARGDVEQTLEKMSGLDVEDKEAQSRLQKMRDTYAPLKASVDKVLASVADPKSNARSQPDLPRGNTPAGRAGLRGGDGTGRDPHGRRDGFGRRKRALATPARRN